MSARSIAVVVDTSPHRSDVGLLLRSARQHFPSLSELRVAPTVRLGFSGSRVYRMRADLGARGSSKVFYAKIGVKNKLEDEYNAYRNYICDQIPNVPTAWFEDRRSEGCLCYYAPGVEDAEVTPLSDYLTHSAEAPTERLCNALERAYNYLSGLRRVSQLAEIDWFEHYQWYLRWERTQTLLESWLGAADCRRHVLPRETRTLVSPLQKVRQIVRERRQSRVKVRPVHGDLHQKNIILEKIGEELNPWLIDFGWTRVFHGIVDYALLEASLKLFHFAPFFSEERFLDLHDTLHESRGIMKRRISPQETACVKLIKLIRIQARREVSPRAWPEEYYLSSLLVSMGLLSIPTCFRRMGWLTSSWFASHID